MTIQIPATLPVHYRAVLAAARPLLSWMVALRTYRDLYARLGEAPGDTFCARALETLDVAIDITAGDLLQLPVSGPVIIVSNHPHGMLDGLALGRAVERQRQDVRILTNHLVAQLPGLSEVCLFVNPSGTRKAAPQTTAGLRAAIRWLEQGHALIVFPAGEVAHRRQSDTATPIESTWHDTCARLARRTGAALLPAFIDGRNRELFYRAGRIHAALRTMMLPRELLAKRGTTVRIRFGSVASAGRNGSDTTAGLRRSVHRLARRTEDMEAELAALPRASKLVESAEFDVCCAAASQIPTVLDEIGRLREVTFRAVGEGTGQAIDLDEFDEHYLHLFVWSKKCRQVAGAYRLGLVDEIVPRYGIRGLYTSTLFRYDARLLERLSPAIELGRSWVREEYQRSSSALLLLWKGIAAFVDRSDKYRVLFGPVSVSSRYHDTSQQLLQAFLAQNFYRRELGELVEAVTPPASQRLPRGVEPTLISDLRDLDALVARLEGDGKGIPVLLRHYLRLNAKLLGFNVDPGFGNVLDALMMVDLADVAPAILTRYFGKERARSLMARLHGAQAA